MRLSLPMAFAAALVLLAVMVSTWLADVNWALAHGTTYRDSLQFYTGATLVRTGRAAELYDLEAQRALQEVLLPAQYRMNFDPDALPFVSPPFVALALAPLTGFSLSTFYILTGVANLLLLAVLGVALQKSVASWPESWRLALVLFPLLWSPVISSLVLGQVSILLAVSFALGYLALRSNKGVLAGVALSLLWVKPQYAVLVLPALVLWSRRSRDWRAAGGFVGATLVLAAVSWATVGFDGLLAYAGLLSRLETLGASYGMRPASYHTLGGLLQRLFGVSGWPWLALSGLLVAVVFRQVRRGSRQAGSFLSNGLSSAEPPSRDYALLILTSVLISPHTYLQDLTLLLPAIALGWEALKEQRIGVALWVSLWGAVGLGLYVLLFARSLGLQSSSNYYILLLTVPAMLLAVGLLLVPGLPALGGQKVARLVSSEAAGETPQ